ncbi:MAG: hypothetical protein HYY06_13910 [Deltaproteobacteria bacterium]|nr:hypothetical protein [Deltaproteobacteria bacterium]
MKAIGRAVLIGLLMVGCESGEFGANEAARGTWALEADESRALVDRRCEGGDCARYPNPEECDRLDVDVFPDGRLCGRCARAEGLLERCGGPAQGLPYRCFLEADEAGLACVVCDDLFGLRVYRECAIPQGGVRPEDAPAVAEGAADDAGRCFELRRADGSACSVCLDDDARVASDDCGAPEVPVQTEDPQPEAEEGAAVEPAVEACPADRDGEILLGRGRFADELNGILAEAGLAADYAVDAADPIGDEGERDGDWDELRVGAFCSEDSDVQVARGREMEDDDGWLRDGELRCGYVVQSAALRACRSLECSTDGIDTGLAGEMGKASVFLEERYECTGSPLVLDLDGDGVDTVRGTARFDLASTGRPSSTAWIRPGDALLALDRDGDGRISSGVELFGEVTRGPNGLAGDGFAALEALDSNHDGAVTGADAEFGRLLVWMDDGDGKSAPGELQPLPRAGISRLDLAAVPVAARDAAGSMPALWSTFARSDGSTGALCDVFFAVR